MNYRFLPPARVEFDEASMFYEHRESELGIRFARQVEAAIGRICDNPETFAVVENGFRYCPMSDFPYIVIYGVDELVEIVAVMHTSRRPGYWRNRLSS